MACRNRRRERIAHEQILLFSAPGNGASFAAEDMYRSDSRGIRFIHLPSLLAAAIGAAGCASMFLHGGHFADGTEKNRVIVKYGVESCVDLSDNSPLQGPTTEYWLLTEPNGRSLAEMDQKGEGTVITNAWADGDGDHFFAWVQATGWEYVVPRDKSQPASRLAYVNVKKAKTGNVTKPAGAPSAKCVLRPIGAPAATAPAPTQPAPVGTTPPVAPPPVAPAPLPQPTAAPPAPAPAPTAAPSPAPAPSATTPAPAPAPSAAPTCFPNCRAGYTCVNGTCVAAPR
jgi:hypothetical protein